MKKILVLLLLGFSAITAYAQAPAEAAKVSAVSYPFSAWVQLGNVSPTEKGTALFNSNIEQGIVVRRVGGFSVTPFVNLSIGADTMRGLLWENRAQFQAGAKLVHAVPHGLVWIGASYGVENRYKNSGTKSAPLTQAGYWLGWNAVQNHGRYPGSSWGVLGTLSAFERNNFSGVFHGEQGVRAGSVRGVHVVPFGEVTTSRDYAGYDWNNRVIGGGGLKLVKPVKNAVIEGGAEYLHEERFNSGLTGGGYALFIRVWTGRGRR